MNLPNALTVARIFAAPVVAALPFIEHLAPHPAEDIVAAEACASK